MLYFSVVVPVQFVGYENVAHFPIWSARRMQTPGYGCLYPALTTRKDFDQFV
jgi:hypothetical protein